MRDIGLTLQYLHRYKRFREGYKIIRTTLERLASQSKQPATQLTHNQVLIKIQQTKEALNTVKKKHEEHRNNFSNHLSQEYTEEGNTKAQTIINSLIDQ